MYEPESLENNYVLFKTTRHAIFYNWKFLNEIYFC